MLKKRKPVDMLQVQYTGDFFRFRGLPRLLCMKEWMESASSLLIRSDFVCWQCLGFPLARDPQHSQLPPQNQSEVGTCPMTRGPGMGRPCDLACHLSGPFAQTCYPLGGRGRACSGCEVAHH
ncbi:uncharacterized protein LOC125032672 [Penaeus chinensis]|uniref:uncharacterized protein LOC125032672 n=1 Tax=Penaeus chinensis TaxID=139456 RepID=UPI001FB5ACA5|nr:uncharacterized protein LOC125032672 [Penaeus chinensis]